VEIAAEIQTERAVELKFEQFPEQARERLRAAISALVSDLQSRVESAEPSLTGALRSETAPRLEEYPNRITGAVRVTDEFAKAGALEYGAHRTMLVKAHTATLDHIYGKLVEPLSVMIGAHQRTPNIAEHRYLRGPLHAMEGQIFEALQEAMTEAAAD
jgi:hypothetical protein